MGIQESIFSQGEGDQWFTRNLSQINISGSFADVEFILERLNPFHSQINQVLEVGCAAGHKVEKMASVLGATPFGIDPSEKAINAASERMNNFENFVVGTVDKINFPDSRFDAVFVAFCMYLVSRDELDRAIGEIDRVLRDGGFLIIEDFDPGVEQEVVYKHHSAVKTYKADYASYFLNLGKYYLIEKKSFSHVSNHFSSDIDERISLQILQKNTNPSAP
jgi:ubiquinone/menaquinone biosynthesis C-methylase UbiE